MEEYVIKCIFNNNIDWANIVMAVTSILNIIIIVVIFKNEQSANNKKEKRDEKKSWYNLLGIQEMTVTISKELDDLKEKAILFHDGSSISQDEILSINKSFEDKLLKYKNEYLTIVDCLDSKTVCSLTSEFQIIQDELYSIMQFIIGEKAMGCKTNSQDIIIRYNNLRKQLVKMSINLV